VLADASPALTPCVERASLWVALLPAEIDAFMRYYLLVKSAQSLRRPGRKFYAVLDRGGPDHDLKKIRLAWDTVTERFLGWPIPILGQIDLGHLADEDVPAARRLRACEETLGPPWPSDLQAQCQAVQRRSRPRFLARSARGRPRDGRGNLPSGGIGSFRLDTLGSGLLPDPRGGCVEVLLLR
jgi:hypothetical protein